MTAPGMPTAIREDAMAVWLDFAILLTVGAVIGAGIVGLVWWVST